MKVNPMMPAAGVAHRVELGDFIDAYEAAQDRDGRADWLAFLPDPGHPLHDAAALELARVDLEFSWRQGRPQRLADYQRLLPPCLNTPEHLQGIAFEEYRLRRQAGEDPSLAEYERHFGVTTAGWA